MDEQNDSNIMFDSWNIWTLNVDKSFKVAYGISKCKINIYCVCRKQNGLEREVEK